MLVAMPLPLTDLFEDGLSPWEDCAGLARRKPERTVFRGSVNPLEGRRDDDGQPFPWRMDDPGVAFPVFEKA